MLRGFLVVGLLLGWMSLVYCFPGAGLAFGFWLCLIGCNDRSGGVILVSVFLNQTLNVRGF
jgi:hypothetical protein